MDINKLKRALMRGNRVVLFTVASHPGAGNVEGAIDYATAVVCASVEDLAAAERFRRKSNALRRSPVGVKAVVVPYLEVLKATKERPHPVNALLTSMWDWSIETVAAEAKVDIGYLHAVRAVYLE